jgi:DmsE family decaheme c-type cytochrome
MNIKIRETAILLILAIPVFALLQQSGYSESYYSLSELTETSETCLDCHEGQNNSLAGSPHVLTTDSNLKSALEVGCISCHDGWEKHLDDPSIENIAIIDDSTLLVQSQVCGRCHLSSHQSAMVTTDPHGRSGMGCLSCHSVHNNPNVMLVEDADGNYCKSCHKAVAGEFKLRSAHPLESYNIQCTDCHNIGGIESPQSAIGHDWSCQECHPETSGPFLYEHPVTYTHLVDGGGCVECHQPHGSVNDRLLNQPGKGLCLQCHSVPPGHFANHSGLGAELACIECHSEIHGSYDNSLLLDPDLSMKFAADCYQSGCHGDVR